MVLAAIAAVLAAVSLACTVLATWEFVRGWRVLGRRRAMSPVTVVIAADSIHGLPRGLVRATAVALHDSGGSLVLALLPDDASTEALIEEEIRSVTGLAASAVSAHSPSRHFPDTWLAAQAFDGCKDDGTLIMVNPCARPALREMSPVFASLGREGPDMAAACPCPAPGEPMSVRGLLGRLASDLGPILFSVFGPPGMLPAMAAARPRTVKAGLDDPLAMNRPGLATATSISLDRKASVLLPTPAGCSTASEGRSLTGLFCEHTLFLSRLAPARIPILGAWVLACPVAIAACILAGSGAGLSLAAASLAGALASKTILAFTWSRAVQGWGSATAGLLITPFRDLAALFLVIKATLGSTVKRDRHSFSMRRGGVLTRDEQDD